jgi:UDP-N-acetylmuramoyl-tripeptide--D-alanyl-D-alanine ligase
MAVAHLLGVPAAEAAAGMSDVLPLPGRGAVLRIGEITLVDESYNANPSALAAVLRFVSTLNGYRRRIAVLGDMLELGETEGAAHEEAGRAAAGAGVDLLVGVGKRMAAAVRTAREAGLRETVHFSAAAEAAAYLAETAESGDLIVVKGSRAIGTEAVIEALRERRAV